MATSEQVQTAVGAHLVGGLKAPDAESAMRTTAGILGRHLHAITDGETGERSQWIFWQLNRLGAIDGIEASGLGENPDAQNEDYRAFPQLLVDASVTALPPRALGYADAAEASYPIYRRLREEGAIPPGVKFQVSIPTPYATVVAWVALDQQERFFPVYADAIRREVQDIAGAIDHDDLVIQYDVAVEFGVLTGSFRAAGNLGEKRHVTDALRQALDDVPEGVERGVHLCYGDYKHRHFAVPADLSLCVEVANEVGPAADFVHMPVDRETGRDPSYHEPLRDLSPVPSRLALGVIDYEGDPQRTRELIAAASEGSGGMRFAVATECGMARIDEREGGGPSLEQLLALHAEVAAPVR
jgi:methionine synthase II (cobalamin-independent)